MGKYDSFHKNMFTDRSASAADRATAYALVAIANELAELSKFLRERMPQPIPREEFEEMLKKI